MPRLVIVLVAIFSDYLGEAYDHKILWPVLGFFLLPLTTLAYAWAWHQGGGAISGIGLVVVIVAVLIDLGLVGAGHRSRRYYRDRYR
jgi:hypothetical protein